MRYPAPTLSISSNSSKVESAGRALVALVFLIALWFDPVQPVRTNVLGVALLTGFLAWSLVLIAVAWQSWWWDHRLARAAHTLDIAVFVGAVYYTEAPSTDFSSPFMAFAVLLLVKARIRWDWRATAWTAIVLLLLNYTVAGTMSYFGYAVDLQRVGRRTAYMMLLAVLLVWMGLERRVRLHLPFPLLPAAAETGQAAEAIAGEAQTGATEDGRRLELLVSTALDFARQVVLARQAAIAWSAEQEPWIDLGVSGPEPGDLRITRLGPDLPNFDLPNSDQFDVPALVQETRAADGEHDALFATGASFETGSGAVLFDSVHRRALSFGPGGQRIALRPQRPPELAEKLGVETGISVPITSDAGSGRLLFWGLADPGFDSLALAQAAAGEIGRAFEREERARLAQVVAVNGAVSGVREAIARDLHDSAAQFLAGTMFRLEALRRRMVGEPDPSVDPGTEIAAIKNAMRLEQRQLRNLIGQLRRGESADRQTDLAQELTALLGELGTHWHLAATLDGRLERGNGPIIVPATLSHEVRQLVREGVANAARHGGGDAVRVEVARVGAWLWLTISDNGRGFPAEAIGAEGRIALRPRSIAGRVAALGGSLAISAAEPHGATLSIGLPLRPVSGLGGKLETGEDQRPEAQEAPNLVSGKGRAPQPASVARPQTATA
ncbi:histidine kinase [Novosphingobium sp.]|uniref:sensor histidine kinase n=1 Tax=Novosphingobium sp. TaxID=1874826 RepID=UPI0025FBC767|nr:histidine kinase [Novosphingobium sp.]